MLRTISEKTGLELEYVSEEFRKGISINIIQYLLKDNENNKYFLLLSFEELPVKTEQNYTGKFGELYWYLFQTDCIPQKVKTVYKNPATNIEVLSEKHCQHIDFSLNRYDLIYPQDNYCVRIAAKGREDYLPVHLDGDTAKVATWMNPIPREGFLAAVRTIFKTFRQIRRIDYQNLLYSPILDRGWKHPDHYLPLPASFEELQSRLSKKGKYNLKRERRIISETFGGLYLDDVSFSEATDELIDCYYEFKYRTHQITKKEYDITALPITNVYVLRTGDNNNRGIALSCEQDKAVFLENHTFDSSMREYSFGQVLYDMYLEKMIEKRHIGVALAGGELEYKKRYGTLCAIARTGTIDRFTDNIYRLFIVSGQKNNAYWLSRAFSIVNSRRRKK